MPDEEKRPDSNHSEEKEAPKKPMKETFYDKIPLTYRQVDIFVKVMIGVVVVLLVVGTILGSRG